MTTKTKVLDHGFVKLIETWGSEESIIEAARMSTGKGFLGWGPIAKEVPSRLPSGGMTVTQEPGDERFLSFLYNNAHMTPFEMCGMIIEVQAPIFVFREWHRHRTFSYNEMSARYTPLPDVNYIPTVERLMMNVNSPNKQAGALKGSKELTQYQAEVFQASLRYSYENAEQLYQDALSHGVPKELARVHLPVGRYSRMRASANLRNWLQFLTLRMAPNAQWEIRQYANAVGEMVKEKFPRTWKLFQESEK